MLSNSTCPKFCRLVKSNSRVVKTYHTYSGNFGKNPISFFVFHTKLYFATRNSTYRIELDVNITQFSLCNCVKTDKEKYFILPSVQVIQ